MIGVHTKPQTGLRSRMSALFLVFILDIPVANAAHIPIDLEDFFTIDYPAVSVLNPSTATMTDDFSFTALTLDPGVDDPDVITPAFGRFLTFNYEFERGGGNIDEFSAYLFNTELGPLWGVLDSVTILDPGFGSVSFGLSAYLTLTLGLQFVLDDPGSETGAMVTISDLALFDPLLTPVSAPPTVWLMLSGLLGPWLLGLHQKKRVSV
jgi:hypothetical protein